MAMKANVLTQLTHELKPCPLCESAATLEPMNKGTGWRVRCKNYECGATHWIQPDPDGAAGIWNKRVKE